VAGASILGTRVQRKEDPKFLTTGGVYADDVADPRLEGAAHAVFVRSAVAHGTIESIDTESAREMPGVLSVHTAESLGLEPIASPFNPGAARSLLASDKVRHVGEPIAVVVAETYQQATDAAEMVFADYEFLPTLVDIEEALASDTLIYEAAGSNGVFDTTALGIPENTPTDEYFADCEVVINGRFINQRVAPCPLEVRASAAVWDGDTMVQWISTQGAQADKAHFIAANGGEGTNVHLMVVVSAPKSTPTPRNSSWAPLRKKSGARCAGSRPAANR
jgi:carbon-monoxide dehydrogenase large subunit